MGNRTNIDISLMVTRINKMGKTEYVEDREFYNTCSDNIYMEFVKLYNGLIMNQDVSEIEKRLLPFRVKNNHNNNK